MSCAFKWALIVSSLLVIAIYSNWVKIKPQSCQPVRYLTSLQLPAVGGKVQELNLSAAPTLIHFWATWCSSCVEELPWLNSFARQHPEINFVLIAVNDQEQAVIKFLKKYHLTNLTVLLDLQGEFSARFCMEKLPESYLLDGKGNYRYKWSGAVDWEAGETEVVIKGLLND